MGSPKGIILSWFKPNAQLRTIWEDRAHLERRARKLAGELGLKANLFGWVSRLEYPHWMMVIGAALLAFGFIGYVFNQNKNGSSDPPKAKERPPELTE